jgi:TPP-dependent pyruvate/acetoin dehydrogenase alpha subunit
VFEACAEAVARARRGEGPSLVEAQTIRWLGHYEGDPQLYRGKDEVAEGRGRDPLARLRRVLEEQNLLDGAQTERVRVAVKGEVDDAVAFAETSPLPDARAAFEDLFAYYPWRD